MKSALEQAADRIALHNVELRCLLLRLLDPDDLGHSTTHEVRQLILALLSRPRGG